jgi:hypothetical protein
MSGWREFLSLVPGAGGICVGFLSDGGPSNPTSAGKLQYNFGLAIDALDEKMFEGIQARMPGYGTPTALPYISLDRGIVRGITEQDLSFETRLQQWLDTWRRSGSGRATLQQVLGYLLAFTPLVRTVDDSANWKTYIPGDNPASIGPSTQGGTSNWNWDNNGDPHPVGLTAWWRWWLILNAGTTLLPQTVIGATNASPIVIQTSAAHGLSTGQGVYLVDVLGNIGANGAHAITVVDATHFSLNGSSGTGAYTSGGEVYLTSTGATGNWVAPEGVWGDGDTWGDGTKSWGLSVPPGEVTSLQNIVGAFQEAGEWCRYMLVAFDAALFSPTHAADNVVNPAGGWGHFSKIVSGQYVASRPVHARYCAGIY